MPLSEHPVCSSCEEKEFEDHKEESNRTFPTDNLRQLSSDSTPIAWSQDEVDKAMDLHLHLGRNPTIDEHVADIWDAAFYLILTFQIWEGWLVDWKNWLELFESTSIPDPSVSTHLYEQCIEPLEILIFAGVVRTDYVDDSLEEILHRLPPKYRGEQWPADWQNDATFFELNCSKVFEFSRLQNELVRLQKHLETSHASPLQFHVIQLGQRTTGKFPGTFLDVLVGYQPEGDDGDAFYQTLAETEPETTSKSAEPTANTNTEKTKGKYSQRLIELRSLKEQYAT